MHQRTDVSILFFKNQYGSQQVGSHVIHRRFGCQLPKSSAAAANVNMPPVSSQAINGAEKDGVFVFQSIQ